MFIFFTPIKYLLIVRRSSLSQQVNKSARLYLNRMARWDQDLFERRDPRTNFIHKKKKKKQLSCMLSTTAERYLGAILIQLSWRTMPQSPGGGTLKPCPQLKLLIIFVSLWHLEIWHQKLRMIEERVDVPSASGETLKSCYSQKKRKKRQV